MSVSAPCNDSSRECRLNLLNPPWQQACLSDVWRGCGQCLTQQRKIIRVQHAHKALCILGIAAGPAAHRQQLGCKETRTTNLHKRLPGCAVIISDSKLLLARTPAEHCVTGSERNHNRASLPHPTHLPATCLISLTLSGRVSTPSYL